MNFADKLVDVYENSGPSYAKSIAWVEEAMLQAARFHSRRIFVTLCHLPNGGSFDRLAEALNLKHPVLEFYTTEAAGYPTNEVYLHWQVRKVKGC